MDYQTLVMSYATLIGLLCNFRQERGARKQADHQQFFEWLIDHQHEEIKKLIEDNHQLIAAIDNVLCKEQEEILREFRNVNEILALILSRIENFAGFSSAIFPDMQISEQAKDILVHFSDSGAHILILLHTNAGPILCLSPGHGHAVNEPRFLEDDLNTLVALGFLSQDYNSKGDPIFRLTRLGAKYVEMIKKADRKIFKVQSENKPNNS